MEKLTEQKLDEIRARITHGDLWDYATYLLQGDESIEQVSRRIKLTQKIMEYFENFVEP